MASINIEGFFMSVLLSTKDGILKYRLTYVDDFYIYCEMEDRSIMIQDVDETTIQFDTKFKATGNCHSYSKTLHLIDYRMFKTNNSKLDSLKNVIELELANCIFNYIDEDLIKLVDQRFGKYNSLDFSKITSSVTIENNVHLFVMKTMRFENRHDPVPSDHVETFLFDQVKKQVYCIDNKKNKQPLLDIFMAARFTSTKIEIFNSMTTDGFKLMIDDGLFGTIVCYDNEELNVYYNTFGDIKHFDEPDTIQAFLSDLMLELVTYDPSALMKNYVEAYDLELTKMSADQLKAVIMADY
jgi:hypothetical protein